MFNRKKGKENLRPDLVYKYRGGNDTIFERDLSSLERNYFWSSSIKALNDPCEGIINWDRFNKQSSIVADLLDSEQKKEKLLGVNKAIEGLDSTCQKAGVYSLSTTSNDELLWAHYSDSHKGFCIEYDLNILLKSYQTNRVFPFPVDYTNRPPSPEFFETRIKSNGMIKEILGFKSKRWEYEKEYRLVTDSPGIHSYNSKALKSIYFGIRMVEEHKQELMKRLKGRGVKYFQMSLSPKSYTLCHKRLVDPNGDRLTYMNYLPQIITKGKQVGFEIKEKQYWRLKKRGDITLEIEHPISESELKQFAEFIKNHLFSEADSVSMLHYLKNQEDLGIAWATSHFRNGEINVKINNFI
ncbi:DUF2971 domain-containing protein [Aquimarina spongiae]|uniref:DUF2971 domain-containing protein n=1 Tax=Aquimarina spongiae TaxID=570521 RepID=A0A1M6B0H2_9FLAO|nr:DUF2971 domain-containing protein [Aquimarina spongiae]SHI42068.1 Protein of unknown function [Aquimarina spongiae]